MSSTSPVVYIIVGGAAVLAVWWIMKQQDRRRHHKEGFNGPQFSDFERDCLKNADAGHGRYWRSPVDYALKPWENPHYQANPHDETLPLIGMAPGIQMLPPYVPQLTGGQYTPGCGDHIDVLSNDFATRKSLFESGNMDYKRLLNGARKDGVVGDYPTPLSVSMDMKAMD